MWGNQITKITKVGEFESAKIMAKLHHSAFPSAKLPNMTSSKFSKIPAARLKKTSPATSPCAEKFTGKVCRWAERHCNSCLQAARRFRHLMHPSTFCPHVSMMPVVLWCCSSYLIQWLHYFSASPYLSSYKCKFSTILGRTPNSPWSCNLTC